MDLPTYHMLKKIADSHDRPIIAQMRRMVKAAYNEKFTDEIRELGIGSAKP